MCTVLFSSSVLANPLPPGQSAVVPWAANTVQGAVAIGVCSLHSTFPDGLRRKLPPSWVPWGIHHPHGLRACTTKVSMSKTLEPLSLSAQLREEVHGSHLPVSCVFLRVLHTSLIYAGLLLLAILRALPVNTNGENFPPLNRLSLGTEIYYQSCFLWTF